MMSKWILPVVLAVITVTITLAATWTWALYGMSDDVGTAWVVTGTIFAAATFFGCMWADLSS